MTPLLIFEKLKKNEDFQSPFLEKNDIEYLRRHIKSIHVEKGNMSLEGYQVSDIIFVQKKDI